MDAPGWARADDLIAATVDYQNNWWRTDPPVAARCRKDAALHDRLKALHLVDTTVVYQANDGAWHQDREPLHAAIVDSLVAGEAPLETPAVYFTIGQMGSGKTSILGPVVDAARFTRHERDRASLSCVAADAVREAIPEYANGLGSLVVQQEAFSVTYERVYPAARDARNDIVYDTIGKLESIEPNVRDLKEAGFAVHVLLASAPLELCMSRVEKRALTQNGRWVSLEAQLADEGRAAAALTTLRDAGLLDGWAVFDTVNFVTCPPIIDGSDFWKDLAPQLAVRLAAGPDL